MKAAPLVQCKACPWKKSTRADRDIPGGYCEAKHRSLARTIRSGIQSLQGGAVMACHESAVGSERLCAGCIAHAVGEGNDIGMRLRVARGDVGRPVLFGEQRTSFEETLPTGRTSKR